MLKLAGKASASGPWRLSPRSEARSRARALKERVWERERRWGMAVGRAAKPIVGAEGLARARVAGRFGCEGCRGRTGRMRFGVRRPAGVVVLLLGAVLLWVGGERLVGEGAREGRALDWVGLKTTVLVERLRLWARLGWLGRGGWRGEAESWDWRTSAVEESEPGAAGVCGFAVRGVRRYSSLSEENEEW